MIHSSGGKTAATSGALLERIVEATVATWITDSVLLYREWLQAGKPRTTLVKHLPYTSIYGSAASRSEFGLVAADGSIVRIECKWQSSAGSVDEKFPYLLENALAVPEQTVLILATGGGAKPAALNWLRREAVQRGAEVDKQILVMTDVSEFMAWAQTHRHLGATLTEPVLQSPSSDSE